MTRNEADERAKCIWGPAAQVRYAGNPATSTSPEWWVNFPGDHRTHFLDRNGHVTCLHEQCLIKEARADRAVTT